DPSRNPLFQVMFALQNAPMETLGPTDLALNLLQVESGTAKFDVSLFLTEVPEGLIGELEYNTDLFDLATIRRLAGHFQTMLEGIVANAQQRLSQSPLLAEPERSQVQA